MSELEWGLLVWLKQELFHMWGNRYLAGGMASKVVVSTRNVLSSLIKH